MLHVMGKILVDSTRQARWLRKDISGAGFGILGFDWSQDKPNVQKTINFSLSTFR